LETAKENNMQLFRTDFYQLSMVLAYVILEQQNDLVGFEGFVRRIDPRVQSNGQAYVFGGEAAIQEFIEIIREELRDIRAVKSLLCQIVLPKVHISLRNIYYKAVMNADLKTIFEFSVAKERSVVKPMVPTFQYYGPKWIGQLIETRICLLMNGKTGLNSGHVVSDNYHPANLVHPNRDGLDDFNKFLEGLRSRAFQSREATGSTLLEAAYRRSPSDECANAASLIALNSGWDGTSNVALYLDNLVPLDKIGGTMAHSFIMSHRSELEALQNWAFVWPNSTMLIDTYDTVGCAKMIRDNNISCSEVRIDSDPLAELARNVHAILPHKGLFLSGDLHAARFSDFTDIPYGKCMVGTKYVNGDPETESVNAGFVYKIVQVTDRNGTYYPEKQSSWKKNYPALKRVRLINDKVVVTNEVGFGIDDLTIVDPDCEVKFDINL
jgi:nicotinic acid phosphoribosyltransferase